MNRPLWITWMLVLALVVVFIPVYGPQAALPSLSLVVALLVLIWVADNLRMEPALPVGAALAALIAVPAYWGRLNAHTLPNFVSLFLLCLVGCSGMILLLGLVSKWLRAAGSRRGDV